MSRRFFLVVQVLVLISSGLFAQEPRQFRLSQARQFGGGEVRLRAYVDLTDGNGAAGPILDPGALSGTFGERELMVEDVGLFRDSLEGIAYIFLIDISRSLQPNQFAVLRRAVDQWVAALGPDDQVAVVAFGETSRLVVDFTSDLDAARTAIANLQPTEDLTALYRALLDTAGLAQRRDPGLPNRRVAIVVSDGRDEGSGVVFEDALERLEDVQIPVYAIGSSRLTEPSRRRHLDELKRLALRTGGDIREVDGGDLAAACREVDRLIRRVWALGLHCPRCIADGDAYRLQLNLQLAERVLSDGKSVRSLPPLALEVADPGTQTASTASAEMGGPPWRGRLPLVESAVRRCWPPNHLRPEWRRRCRSAGRPRFSSVLESWRWSRSWPWRVFSSAGTRIDPIVLKTPVGGTRAP